MASDDKVVIGLASEGAAFVPGAELKGAPSLYEFTEGGALTFSY